MNSEDFKAALAAAADEVAKKQARTIEFALRQAFYDGVSFEMNRRREELINATKAAS